MSTMRVASYNLKDFTLDRHAAARVIRCIDPDVLCLQEVPRRLFSTWRQMSRSGRSWSPDRGIPSSPVQTFGNWRKSPKVKLLP